VDIFRLFFLCTKQSVFRSYFDLRLPFSPGVFRNQDIAVQSSRIGHHQEKMASGIKITSKD